MLMKSLDGGCLSVSFEAAQDVRASARLALYLFARVCFPLSRRRRHARTLIIISLSTTFN